MKHIILGVQLASRAMIAQEVQKLLTQYGCSIKTRVGFHDVHGGKCSPTGIIMLEMFGDEKPINELVRKLNALKGVKVKKMVFG